MKKIKDIISELKEKYKKIKPVLNEKYDKIKEYFKQSNVIKYIFLCILICYIAVTYNSIFFEWYNENIIPIIALFESNIWSVICTYIILIIIAYDLIKKYKNRYQYDSKIVILLIFLSIQMSCCRFGKNYYYDYLIWKYGISYVDVLNIVIFAYIIIAVINRIRLYWRIHKDSKKDEQCDNKILNDWPIEESSEDILDLNGEAKKLAEKIESLNCDKTWSIAVTASWGIGKTSFINLIKKNIDEKNIKIVTFLPRDSKSFKNIQEDFFSMIACVLSEYDSKCNRMFKDYMASLQLIDNRGIVEKIINFYRIWNKEELKNNIEKSFISLNKKILVFIDDFDRLSKEEILEVLKLIDSNAAFKNLIFLTAYDKEQVNKSLGELYQSKDACFVDKFFNLEYPIPSRPYSYISRYMEEKLCKLLDVNDEDKKLIQQLINYKSSIIEDYIPTLRDVKRYINQVVIDYEYVKGDVFVDEYLLVELIKYRYPDLYKRLFRKEYVYTDISKLILKNDVDEKLEIYPILKSLFMHINISVTTPYHHIYDAQSFNNYFVNDIYSSLRIRDMEIFFNQKRKNVFDTLDSWIKDNNKINAFFDYLGSFDMDKFTNGFFYTRYAEMNAYLACKLPDSRAYWLFMKTIYLPNIEEYKNLYQLDFDNYKKNLLDIIMHNDSKFTLISNIHVSFKTAKLNEEEQLIKDQDIWSFIKDKFIEATKDSETDDMWLLGLLHKCIDKMDEKRVLHLDKDCLKAYRDRVEKAPDFYINNFVFLGGASSSSDYNSVACDAFWQQIFNNETEFETFMEQCKDKNIGNYLRVSNFWQLYKSNDFKPIEFSEQGPVQDKIDNNLVEEIKKLESMKKIRDKISKIPNDISTITPEKKEEYISLLSEKQKELDKIQLYIKLNADINKMIDEKKNILKGD